MKHLHLLAYCPDEKPENIVWYFVLVGKSFRDVRALHYLRGRCSGSSFFLAAYNNQVAKWLEMFAGVTFSNVRQADMPVALLRRKVVPVINLVRFLRICPAALLNSPSISFPALDSALVSAGCKTLAQVMLEKSHAARR